MASKNPKLGSQLDRSEKDTRDLLPPRMLNDAVFPEKSDEFRDLVTVE